MRHKLFCIVAILLLSGSQLKADWHSELFKVVSPEIVIVPLPVNALLNVVAEYFSLVRLADNARPAGLRLITP